MKQLEFEFMKPKATTFINLSKCYNNFSYFPEEAGAECARYLIKNYPSLINIGFDTCNMSATFLIGAFVRALYRVLKEKNLVLYGQLGQVEWKTKFDFQQENIERWKREIPFTF